jgi:hypothetical protein
MRRQLAILSFVSVFALGGACSNGGDSVSCPSCDNTVTWTSYGPFNFERSGSDSTAREIISEFGWEVHNNHNGGSGGTLQITSCEEGVILVWAFNEFHAYRVADGWAGRTQGGIRIGDTVEEVLLAEPFFTQVDDTSYMISDGDIRVEANFADNRLEELIVGRFFRR